MLLATATAGENADRAEDGKESRIGYRINYRDCGESDATRGNPLGLSGEDIPIEGRISAVADVFDALSSKRPFKEAIPREKCFRILEEGRRKHFDPNVLDAFFQCSDQIIDVQIRFSNI